MIMTPPFTPMQLAKYYGFPEDLKGDKQNIAIIALDGALDMDQLKKDFIDLGVSPFPNIKEVNLAGATTASFSIESHIDIEVIGSICPNANITVYRGANNVDGFTAAINAAIDANEDVISISYVMSEDANTPSSAMEQALQKAKQKNITVLAAAGDGGSSNALSLSRQAIPASDNRAHVGYPASSPNVLCCGGTELSSNGNPPTEVVWNKAKDNGQATGGGVSSCFPLPDWQAKINIKSANDNISTGRIVPDVSGLAAKGEWSMYIANSSFAGSGTSAVAPLWASLIALANQQRSTEGKPRLGFVNELLYGLDTKNDYFNDVTEGNNKPTTTYPGYEAGNGFDACSGWGTPKAAYIVEALTKA